MLSEMPDLTSSCVLAYMLSMVGWVGSYMWHETWEALRADWLPVLAEVWSSFNFVPPTLP